MDRFEKQPYEQFTIGSDFIRNLAVAEEIVDQSVSVYDKDGLDVSEVCSDQTTLQADVSKVTIMVRAGADAGSPYKITFRCTTSANHRWENDIQMTVRDI
jgi:hypothetical protein